MPRTDLGNQPKCPSLAPNSDVNTSFCSKSFHQDSCDDQIASTSLKICQSQKWMYSTIGHLVTSQNRITTSSCKELYTPLRRSKFQHRDRSDIVLRTASIGDVHFHTPFRRPQSIWQTHLLDEEHSYRQITEFAEAECPKGLDALCLKSFLLRAVPEGPK